MARDAKKRTLKVEGAVLYHETRGEGPLLILIPGGPSDADSLLSLAETLANQFKVVTYDPRGNSRSRFDNDPVDQDMNVHSDDAAALISEFDQGHALVFGNSGGAQIGLNLCARFPHLVRRLIAHEPPCISLLPEFPQLLRAMNQIIETYHKLGSGPAMVQFTQMAGIVVPERTPQATTEPRSPSPFLKANFSYFLEHGMLPIARSQPDIETLRQSQVIIGVGAKSEGQLAHRTGVALAKALSQAPVIFPGDHSGWISNPVDFANVIASQLMETQP